MNAKEKGIGFLEKECKSSYIDVNGFEHYSTNNISMALDIAIHQAKKEEFDYLEKLLTKYIREEKRKLETQHRLGIIRALSFVRREIKQHHLTTPLKD